MLVVDDEHSIVDAVSTALRYEGFTVATAMSGRSAIAAVQEGSFDLIVLDVMLPDVDGFDVAARLRADGIETPILFLTARTGLDDKAKAFGLGADDYVTKPFSLAEIVMRVRAILRRSAGRRDGAAGEHELRYADVVMNTDAHQVWRADRADPAHGDRVPAAQTVPDEPWPGAVEVPDPRSRVALRLRWRLERVGDLHQLSAAQAERARRAAHPHRAAGRLRAPRRT